MFLPAISLPMPRVSRESCAGVHPHAGGEAVQHAEPVCRPVRHGLTDLVLPEYLRLGGLSRLRQAAAIADAHGAMVAPHQAQSPLGPAVNVHFDVATPNAFIQECFDDFHVAWAKVAVRGGRSRPSRTMLPCACGEACPDAG